jgi:hypothetical protein
MLFSARAFVKAAESSVILAVRSGIVVWAVVVMVGDGEVGFQLEG